MGLESKIGQKLRPVALWTDTHTDTQTDRKLASLCKNSSRETVGNKLLVLLLGQWGETRVLLPSASR